MDLEYNCGAHCYFFVELLIPVYFVLSLGLGKHRMPMFPGAESGERAERKVCGFLLSLLVFNVPPLSCALCSQAQRLSILPFLKNLRFFARVGEETQGVCYLTD